MALEVEGVHTYYGESHVLHGVSLRVGAGEVLAILGRNGMGKTTLIRSIVGFTPPRAGHVRYKDAELTRLPPYRMVELGLALVPQGRRVFPSLSVRENLDVARHGTGRWSLEQVYALFPRLRERAGNRANKLSGGEQQMLAIGRALTLNPKVLLLDEPTEGLAPIIVEELLRAIGSITRAGGICSIIVEQHAQKILSLADRVVILERGAIVHDAESRALKADPAALERHLGVAGAAH